MLFAEKPGGNSINFTETLMLDSKAESFLQAYLNCVVSFKSGRNKNHVVAVWVKVVYPPNRKRGDQPRKNFIDGGPEDWADKIMFDVVLLTSASKNTR